MMTGMHHTFGNNSASQELSNARVLRNELLEALDVLVTAPSFHGRIFGQVSDWLGRLVWSCESSVDFVLVVSSIAADLHALRSTVALVVNFRQEDG